MAARASTGPLQARPATRLRCSHKHPHPPDQSCIPGIRNSSQLFGGSGSAKPTSRCGPRPCPTHPLLGSPVPQVVGSTAHYGTQAGKQPLSDATSFHRHPLKGSRKNRTGSNFHLAKELAKLPLDCLRCLYNTLMVDVLRSGEQSSPKFTDQLVTLTRPRFS